LGFPCLLERCLYSHSILLEVDLPFLLAL